LSENKIDKNMLAISIVVWGAVAVSVAFMVAYAGITGVVFAFVVLIVALGTWSRVLREYYGKKNKEEDQLAEQIKDLTKEIQELRKELEE